MALEMIDLKNEFLTKILRDALEDSNIYDVQLMEQKPAIGKGQNFASELMRLTLKYSSLKKLQSKNNNSDENKIEETISLIMKAKPSNSKSFELIKNLNCFEVEAKILREILPRIEQLVGLKLGPKFIYESIEPLYILMEDLGTLGFKNANRQVGFSLPETLAVIETIAKFHAGSVFFNEEHPGVLPKFHYSLMDENFPEEYLNIVTIGLRDLSGQIRNWNDERCLKTVSKLEKLQPEIISRIREDAKFDSDEFCVLNHGDCWINNVMIHEDNTDGNIQVRLVDYQISLWSSPAIDLIYFLGLGPSIEVKCELYDFVLGEYLKFLRETMQKIGCKTQPPTLSHLKKSIDKRRAYSIMVNLAFYPTVYAEGIVEDLDDVFDEKKSLLIFQKPAVIDALKTIVPWMDDKGYLD